MSGTGVNAWVAIGVGGTTLPSSLFGVVKNIIENSLGAGITLAYLSTYNAQYAFAMAGPQPWVRGFRDLNNPLSTDGQFASLIYNNPSA